MSSFAVKLGTYALGTQAAIEAIKVIRSRRVQQYPVIREDVTLIPVGQMQPIQIEFRGTLAGSDYTSMRTELENINNALEGGRQSLYIDGDRFVRVINATLDYSFLTTDFCNYSVRFMGETPYFLAEVVSSDVSTPTSGDTFPITNNGQVKVPVKVVITAMGAAAGSTDTDQQIENHTLGLLGKYTGFVAETADVVIDAGHDNYNVPDYVITHAGVAAMSAFEGDFPYLKDGVNYLEYTGVANATVALYWREAYRA